MDIFNTFLYVSYTILQKIKINIVEEALHCIIILFNVYKLKEKKEKKDWTKFNHMKDCNEFKHKDWLSETTLMYFCPNLHLQGWEGGL